MRFFVGQVYERSTDGREATVIQVRKEGQEALLHLADTGAQEWCVFKAGEWRLKAWPKP